MADQCPKEPSYRSQNSGFFYTKGGRGGGGVVADNCKLLGVGILCSCSCPHRSGHDVPVNLQQDKRYSLFCNFLSLYEWKCIIPLKVRALRMGCYVYFRLQAAFFYKRCRASMTKHRQQNTKVKVKETDLIWSQICSSLLHLEGKDDVCFVRCLAQFQHRVGVWLVYVEWVNYVPFRKYFLSDLECTGLYSLQPKVD